MAVSRRTLLSLTMTGAAGLALGPKLGHAASETVSSTTATLAADFTSHFGRLGYDWIAPLQMITGHSFNGGLRYDDTRKDPVPGKSMFVQPAARVEDAARGDVPGVLALFTIFGVRVDRPEEPGALFGQVLTWLVEQRGLDPARLVFVSTDTFMPYRDRHDIVRAGRVLQRARDEARNAGDGSGFFAPKGHPEEPAIDTVGIYYPLPGAPTGELSYPLNGYLEIGEISITPLDRSAVSFEACGFGLERLVMAEGGAAPDFETSRQALLRLIEHEADRTGAALPKGYEIFSAS